MKRLALCVVVVLAVIAYEHPADAERVQWSEAVGGNGHWYEPILIPDGITWTEANQQASAAGGYLASITSADENQFVYELIDESIYWNVLRAPKTGNQWWLGPWLGGYQPPGSPEPAGDWRWTSSEPFVYSNWERGEPNDSGDEDYLLFFNTNYATGPAPTWNDERNAARVPIKSYVVEYAPPPPSFYGLVIGVDYPGRGITGVNHHPTAEAFRDALQELVAGERAEIQYLPLSDANPGEWKKIDDALEYFGGKVFPGDRFLFYYSGHGGSFPTGNERMVYYAWDFIDQLGWSTGNEVLAIAGDDTFSDNELTQAMNGPEWSEVKKMVILDTCHSGGFWGADNPDDAYGDLENLDNIALLASCPEDGYSWFNILTERNTFSAVIIDGMSFDHSGKAKADANGDGKLAFSELASWASNWDWARVIQQEGDNLVIGDLFDLLGQRVEPIAYEVASFSNMADDSYIPEPATLSLLALGSLLLIRRRAR